MPACSTIWIWCAGRNGGRWPFWKGELDKLKAEEKGASDTDLTEIRKAWLDDLKNRGIQVPKEQDDLLDKAMPVRNHGLFSKAERALTIAGWSEQARRDIEIFRLEDVEGLTPLLMVLDDDGSCNARSRAAEQRASRGSPVPA